MSAKVVQLKQLVRSDWTPRELGEFYRVEAVLIQAGLSIETDCGVSDEGDPWFAFCRRDDGEVLVHLARIQGSYILAGASYDGVTCGGDICALVRNLTDRHPLIQMQGRKEGCRIFTHPVALLVSVVAAALFKSSTDARALTADGHRGGGDARGGVSSTRIESSIEAEKTIVIDAVHGAAVLSAINSIFLPTVSASESLPGSDVFDTTIHSRAVSDAKLPAILPEPTLNHHIQLNPVVVEPFHAPIIGDVIPIFTLLWDLATPSFSTVAVGEVSTIPLPITPFLEAGALSLVVTMSSNREKGALPIVQSIKITGPASHEETSIAQDDPQAYNFQKVAQSHEKVSSHSASYSTSDLDQLSSSLITALKIASHTSIAVQQSEAGPFATTLINLLLTKSHQGLNTIPENTSPETVNSSGANAPRSDNANAITASDGASGAISPAESASRESSGMSHAASSVTAATPENLILNVEKIVQDFMAHTIWQSTTEGKQVVIFDLPALTDPSPHELASVTFDFSDGSTLSLVGLAATVHHATMV